MDNNKLIIGMLFGALGAMVMEHPELLQNIKIEKPKKDKKKK
jgi:hypothetical protein